ncbi:MAG: hypothetical protein LAO07_19920 [Acidobacteriia bacterium]|nr:hypothetical protein [Terriglobia bacterium]
MAGQDARKELVLLVNSHYPIIYLETWEEGRATEGFSGAEIEQAIKSALCSAFSLKTQLSTELILKEAASTCPLSQTMKERVEGLREWARDRGVPAN